MFEFGTLGELLIICVAILLLFGPKEIPEIMTFAGRWFGKFRRLSRNVQKLLDQAIHEAEIEDYKENAKKQALHQEKMADGATKAGTTDGVTKTGTTNRATKKRATNGATKTGAKEKETKVKR